MTGSFHTQNYSNAENVSIWSRVYEFPKCLESNIGRATAAYSYTNPKPLWWTVVSVQAPTDADLDISVRYMPWNRQFMRDTKPASSI